MWYGVWLTIQSCVVKYSFFVMSTLIAATWRSWKFGFALPVVGFDGSCTETPFTVAAPSVVICSVVEPFQYLRKERRYASVTGPYFQLTRTSGPSARRMVPRSRAPSSVGRTAC